MSHFVKLLDKNKIAYNTDDEWLLITIDKKSYPHNTYHLYPIIWQIQMYTMR